MYPHKQDFISVSPPQKDKLINVERGFLRTGYVERFYPKTNQLEVQVYQDGFITRVSHYSGNKVDENKILSVEDLSADPKKAPSIIPGNDCHSIQIYNQVSTHVLTA